MTNLKKELSLSSLEDIKKISISLKNFFQSKDIDIKQSLILEGLSKALDYHDWNTLSAVLSNKSNENNHNSIYYPMTVELLESMAMRSDHSFGLLERDSIQYNIIMEEMKTLYKLYKDNKTDEQISHIISLGIISIRQIREEVTGNGFFQPKLKI